MRKTMKRIASAIICMTLIASSSITAFAEDSTNTYTQMATELVANEKNPEIRNAAISIVTSLTGEKETQYHDVKGTTYVYGVKDVKTNTALAPYCMVGGSCFGLSTPMGTNYALFKASDVNIEQNKSDMQLLYNSIQEVKTATANMSDMDKVNYIASYLGNRVTYGRASSYGGSALRTGEAMCGGFSSLFYIFALNAGLDVSCYGGLINSGNIKHAFNDVVIDGTRYIVDLTEVGSQYLFTPEEYATICSNWTQF